MSQEPQHPPLFWIPASRAALKDQPALRALIDKHLAEQNGGPRATDRR